MRKSESKKNYYWTDDTEAAIAEYKAETDTEKKSDIFATRIYPAMEQLVFQSLMLHSNDTLMSDAAFRVQLLTHLWQTIDKYDVTRKKSFSYFNRVTRNYILREHYDRAKSQNKYTSISEMDGHDFLVPSELILWPSDNDFDFDFDNMLKRYDDFYEWYMTKAKKRTKTGVVLIKKTRKLLHGLIKFTKKPRSRTRYRIFGSAALNDEKKGYTVRKFFNKVIEEYKREHPELMD